MMKKVSVIACMVFLLGVYSCGSDDEVMTCQACSVLLKDYNICDNGNGTADVTVTTLGVTNTVMQAFEEGQNFEEFVAQTCAAPSEF